MNDARIFDKIDFGVLSDLLIQEDIRDINCLNQDVYKRQAIVFTQRRIVGCNAHRTASGPTSQHPGLQCSLSLACCN